MITNFNSMYAQLKNNNVCKRMIVAWAVDEHTIESVSKATDLGFIKSTLIGDEELISKACNRLSINPDKFTIVNKKDETEAIEEAVRMVHEGKGDFLMKGLCSTDKFLHAILNKESGLLPPKSLLLHV